MSANILCGGPCVGQHGHLGRAGGRRTTDAAGSVPRNLTLAWLFVSSGSWSAEATLLTATIGWAACTAAVISKTALEPLASDATEAVTTPSACVAPPVPEIKSRPAGKMVRAMTALAVAGPALLMVKVRMIFEFSGREAEDAVRTAAKFAVVVGAN